LRDIKAKCMRAGDRESQSVNNLVAGHQTEFGSLLDGGDSILTGICQS
jgi:hypothetical protein